MYFRYVFVLNQQGQGFKHSALMYDSRIPKYWSSIPWDEFVPRCLVVWPMRRSAAVPECLYTSFFQYDTLKPDTHKYNSFFEPLVLIKEVRELT